MNPSARGPFCLLNRPSGPGSAVRPTPGIRAARRGTGGTQNSFSRLDVEMLMIIDILKYFQRIMICHDTYIYILISI